MKRVFTFLCCVIALTWSGCSKEDDEETFIDLSQLVGTWETVKYYDGQQDKWDTAYGTEYGFVSTKQFRSDGTATFRSEDLENSDVSEIDFTYTVDANTITLTEIGSSVGETARIEKLTANEFVYSFEYQDGDGVKCTDKEYHKRID